MVAETSQLSTATIPNLALFHGAIFTAASTRPCTEATVTAGYRKLLCQALHNIAVMGRNGFELRCQYAGSDKLHTKPCSYLHLGISVTARVQQVL